MLTFLFDDLYITSLLIEFSMTCEFPQELVTNTLQKVHVDIRLEALMPRVRKLGNFDNWQY